MKRIKKRILKNHWKIKHLLFVQSILLYKPPKTSLYRYIHTLVHVYIVYVTNKIVMSVIFAHTKKLHASLEHLFAEWQLPQTMEPTYISSSNKKMTKTLNNKPIRVNIYGKTHFGTNILNPALIK